MTQISATQSLVRRLVSQHSLAEIELDLARVTRVFRYMGLGTIPFVYTIGGTNGKGTCGALLASASQAMGLKTGLYSSPHLDLFEERVCINGVAASEQEWSAALEEVEKARQSIPLTYFEYCTLACFYIFASHQLDIWILEVGLGGRLDAVNIIDCDCAVITSIDLDHMDRLGNSRASILYEKLGIVRASCPLVYGDPNPPANFDQLIQAKKPELKQINRDYGSSHRLLKGDELVTKGEIFFADLDGCRECLPTRLVNPLLATNLATAWQSLLCYRNRQASSRQQLKIARLAANRWQEFYLVGRWQKEELGNTSLLFDVAHNPAAASLLAKRLQDEKQPIEIVVGLMKNKDWEGFVAPLVAISRKWHAFPLSVERAFTVDSLVENLATRGISVQQHSSALSLLAWLQTQSEAKLVVFCGSFYLVGEALGALRELRKPKKLKHPDKLATAYN